MWRLGSTAKAAVLAPPGPKCTWPQWADLALPSCCLPLSLLQFKIEPFKHPLKLDPNYAGRR